jgi:glycosyltransferase involved in cell wall biosynthesis
MRIAHVSDCYLPRLGGIELHVHDLALRQAAAGHDVTVITATGGPATELSDGVGTVVRIGAPASNPAGIDYSKFGRGRSAVADSRFDVVHVHASTFSPLGFVTAHNSVRRGIPTVATLHSLWARSAPLFRVADRLARWGDWPVVWSAVSNAAAAPLRHALAGRANVAVLPNGIDGELWQVDPVAGAPGEMRLAAVMRLAPRKRPMHLARTLRASSRRLPPGTRLSVDIVGDGPERAPLERYLRRHGMTGWVRLCGHLNRSQIRSIYARSDLFVAPAKLESFGIAALEARCAGLPVVALAGTGVTDFVTHGTDGWLVESAAEMVDTIVGLVNSPDSLRRVSEHNRSVAPNVTWRGVLRSCQALYREAAFRQGLTWRAGRREAARQPVWAQ